MRRTGFLINWRRKPDGLVRPCCAGARGAAVQRNISGTICFLILNGASLIHGSDQGLSVQGDHPRLFFVSERIVGLQKRVAANPSDASAWSKLLAGANRAVGRRDVNSLELLSLALRMTGEQRFADEIRGILLRECGRKDWHDRMLMRRNSPWHSGLNMAHKCFATAMGFDRVYDYLSQGERETIARGIVNRGILPTLNDWVLGEWRVHSLDTMGHNWWSECVFSAGIAALAVIDEEPRAEAWLGWYGSTLVPRRPSTWPKRAQISRGI